MVYFLKGGLPWQGLKGGKTKEERDEILKDKKISTTIDMLCQGLPDEFKTFLNYCRKL